MALDENAENDRRDERDHRERARLAIEGALEAQEGAENGGQRESGSAREDEGEEEFRPTGDEGEDGGGDDARGSERNGDPPQRLPARAAIDEGCFLQRLRHLAEIS